MGRVDNEEGGQWGRDEYILKKAGAEFQEQCQEILIRF